MSPLGRVARYDAVPGPAPSPADARSRAGALQASASLRRGTFALAVDLTAEPGEVVAVLGPNGAGKSTFLAVLAGLVRPDRGTVELGGRLLTAPGVTVPAEQRRIGLMGQDPLLFPHLNALDNIAFGPQSQGTHRRQARAKAGRWLREVGLAEFAHRRPSALSGGQQQRVALARALAAEPELLLLDEPLGALDAQTVPDIRQLLRRHIRASGTTTVLVTHDVIDAATLADRVVVLDEGVVVEAGPVAAVLGAPRSAFTAALAGVNLLGGVAAGDACEGRPTAVEVPRPGRPVFGRPALGQSVSGRSLPVSGLAAGPISAGCQATAVFPPAAVAVYLDKPPAGSPRNTWPAIVTALEPGATSVRVKARPSVPDPGTGYGVIPDRHDDELATTTTEATTTEATTATTPEIATEITAELTAAAVAELHLVPGSRVYLSIKATEIRIHSLFAG